MTIIWHIFLCIAAVLVVFILPIQLFFYESDEDFSFVKIFLKQVKKLSNTFCNWCYLFGVLLFLLGLLFIFGRGFKFPTQIISSSAFNMQLSETKNSIFGTQIEEIVYFKGSVTFLETFFASVSLIGSALCCFYLGNGLIYFPWYNFRIFRERPTSFSKEEFASICRKLSIELKEKRQELETLIERKHNVKYVQGFLARKWEDRKTNEEKRQFMRELEALEKLYNIYKIHKNINEYNPVYYVGRVIAAIIGLILSFLYLTNMYFFFKPRIFGSIFSGEGEGVFPILDWIFDFFEQHFGGVFCTLLFCGFSFYLLNCLLLGCENLGLRFLTLVPIHPLVRNGTWTNSFLVNLIILLLCDVALIHLSTLYFKNLTGDTAAAHMFRRRISEVKTISWIYDLKLIDICLVVFGGLSYAAVYFLQNWSCFKGKGADMQAELDNAKKELGIRVAKELIKLR